MAPEEIYLNFLYNALYGNAPSSTDEFYKEHSFEIDYISTIFMRSFGTSGGPIYRGILVDEGSIDGNGKLIPLPSVTYTSFSLDINVALDFADINSDTSFMIKHQNPKAKGYLITLNRVPYAQVLWDYKWLTSYPKLEYVLRRTDLDMDLIHQQKEIILCQMGQKYDLVPKEVFSVSKDSSKESRVFL